jgi:hypothetical protein
MQDIKSYLHMSLWEKVNQWSENSALRAKVEALEKEACRLRDEKAAYYGIATELLVDSQAVNALLAVREAVLLQKYQNAGVSLGARLRDKLNLWKLLLFRISENATTLQMWIARDTNSGGTKIPTDCACQPRTFLGTGLG